MIEFDEDIEFKPLSNGLGFHPKKTKGIRHAQTVDQPTVNKIKKYEPLKKPEAVKKTQPDYSAETHEEVDTVTPVWMQPATDKFNPWAGDLDIGRQPSVDGMVEGGMENSTIIENPFFVPSKVSSPVEVVTLRFSGYDGLKKKKVKPITGSFTAIMMDVLMLISICMIVLTVVLSATGQQSISVVLRQLSQDAAQRSTMFGTIIALGFLYLVFARCFFGRTLGEWMMRMQLGSNDDQAQASYPIKVLFRTTIVFLTGLLVFPLISWLFNKDLLGYFSGLEMHVEVAANKN